MNIFVELKIFIILMTLMDPVAVLDLPNWRGSAPVFCGLNWTKLCRGLGLKLGGLTLNWGAKPPLAPS